MSTHVFTTVVILFLCVNILVVANGNADDGCFNLVVELQGEQNYQPHDELVMLREYNENESAPILYSTRCNETGTAVFCVEDGEYWVDVRNIWCHLVVGNETVEFTFPYKLYEDSEYYTNNSNESGEGNNNFSSGWQIIDTCAGLGIVAIFFAIIKRKR